VFQCLLKAECSPVSGNDRGLLADPHCLEFSKCKRKKGGGDSYNKLMNARKNVKDPVDIKNS
jgi:hypothetical protein